ncbi:MAG: SpoIIE family protein phosphatase [Clostridiales bacterium]|nr:SpoIIE family protein phosphatase [Clostridiales bacterium]
MFTREKRQAKPAAPARKRRKPVWRPWMALPLRLAGGFWLSRSLVLGSYSPFALGFVAASGPGLNGLAALVGAGLGYLTGLGLSGSLRYIATALLAFAVAFAFADLPVYRSGWLMSVGAAIATGLTGFVYLSASAWTAEGALYFASETLLAGVSCRFYQNLTSRSSRERRGAMLYLAVTLLCALAPVPVPGVGTLGAVLGAALVLTAARAGSGVGAVCGAGTGLVLAAAGAGSGALAGALAFAGMLAGSDDIPHGRLWQVAFGLCGGLSALVWLGGGVSEALALTAGAVLCLMLPESVLRLADRVSTGRMDGTASALSVQQPETPERAQETARYRLGEQATAFRTLYQRLRESMAEHPTGESTSVIFDRTARRVCKGCALEGSCWKWDHHDTYDDLSAALKAMQERGSGEARDYPERFRRKCLRFDAFRTAANEELFAFWTRRQYRMRLRESRTAVCRQYAQLARLLEDAAAELDEELRFECTGSAAADRALDRLGVRGEAGLWLDGRGRRVLTVTGRKMEALKTQEGLRELRSALGVPVELWESTPVRSGVRLTFRQTPPLAATVGVAVRKKEGQAISGDSGSWFKDEQGNLWMTVCDGMGSGEAASRESSLVLHLVEDFIHAGVEPEAALTTLTGALSLRGEIDGGFTTVDLLHIDLFTGAGELYKLGGAPSYLRRRGSVSRVSGAALPAGLELEGENRPDVTHFRLFGGDCALLLSDGVTDGTGDLWLRTLMERWEGDSPRQLAEDILKNPRTRTTDDCTVAVVRLKALTE